MALRSNAINKIQFYILLKGLLRDWLRSQYEIFELEPMFTPPKSPNSGGI